jgi:hypothetical protein
MDRRTTQTCLTVERLDERVVPSHGKAELHDESHGLALGHEKRDLEEPTASPASPPSLATELVDDSVELVSTKLQITDQSETVQLVVTVLLERDVTVVDPPAHGTVAASESEGKSVLPAHAPAGESAGAVTHVELPARGPHDGAAHPSATPTAAEVDDVRVPGSLGIQTRGDRIRFISTDVPHATPSTVVALDVAGVSADSTTAAAPADETETGQPIEVAVPPSPAANPAAAPAPQVQAPEAVARFVPVSPAALDGAVRRFLDGLKSSDREGLSLGGKIAAWATALAGCVVVAEIARRKRLPQKAARYLSLSRLLTRTKTK